MELLSVEFYGFGSNFPVQSFCLNVLLAAWVLYCCYECFIGNVYLMCTKTKAWAQAMSAGVCYYRFI